MKHIVLITDKQPSSNPRLVKEAFSLYLAGYGVTVIFNFWSRWAEEADEQTFKKYAGIQWLKVGGHPINSKKTYWMSRLRHKFYRVLAAKFKANLRFQVLASAQFFPELQLAARSIKADLYIAHNLAALPAAANAANKNKAGYAFDAEDFHRKQEGVTDQQAASITLIENHYFKNASYISAASPLIAMEYGKLYPSRQFVTINNVFRKKQQPVLLSLAASPLKLFWFSQTVGLKRGLQDAVSALNSINEFPVVLNILGDVSIENKKLLFALLTESLHTINFIKPCNEDQLVYISSQHHIGLAVEPGYSFNYKLALTNKLFTYLLAGNALVVSDTPAQKLFFNQNPGIGWCYATGDAGALAIILKEAYSKQEELLLRRQNAWDLANTTFNWEVEQKYFLELVKQAL